MPFDFKNTMSQRNTALKQGIGRRPPAYLAHNHSTNTDIPDPNKPVEGSEVKNSPSPKISRRVKPVK